MDESNDSSQRGTKRKADSALNAQIPKRIKVDQFREHILMLLNLPLK